MLEIAIDAGNTSIKSAIYHEDGETEFFHNMKEFDIISLVNRLPEAQVIVASVGSELVNFNNLAINKDRVHFLDSRLKLPIKNSYKSPETLGADRLAAVCGAWQSMPNANSLVIDVGTCVTYDFIDKFGVYQGGMISPGLDLRFKTLKDNTSRLPLLSKSEGLIEILGKETSTSIQSGVQNGMVFEINGTIAALSLKYPDLRVLVCGGDSGIFESQIKHPIFADPNLVLSGLHAILRFNYP